MYIYIYLYVYIYIYILIYVHIHINTRKCMYNIYAFTYRLDHIRSDKLSVMLQAPTPWHAPTEAI